MRNVIVSLALCIASIGTAAAAEWVWPTTFSEATDPSLEGLHSDIHRMRLDGSTPGVPVAGGTLKADSMVLTIVEGTLFEETPVDGVKVGAWFQGRATLSFRPASRVAKDALKDQWGEEAMRDVPLDWFYLFTLRGKDPAAEFGADAEAAVPWTGSTQYAGAKAALRMTGLRLLHSFLNREGRSEAAVFVVFAPEASRRKEPDSHFLFAYDPNVLSETSLSVFGNAGAILDPDARRALEFNETLKYSWFRMVSEASTPPVFRSHAKVAKYDSVVRVSGGVRSASLETTVNLTPNAGAFALAFAISPRLQVSEVRTKDGATLPFAQWKDNASRGNLDPSVIVRMPGAPESGSEMQLTVVAEGLLFDSFAGGAVQAEEDLWKPTFDDPEGSIYELHATVPKNSRVAAAGRLLSEEIVGGDRVYHFLTSRPVNFSTFYVGPFDTYEAEADGIDIVLLHAPVREEVEATVVSENPKYTVEEVANAVRVYSRLTGVPLELKQLRVATTPTGHGRGFEGLILLSKYGGTSGDQSWADVFRAHEVAHQWWGGMVLSKRWPEDRWLTESFAEYMAMEYYDVRFQKPDRTVQRIKELWIDPIFMETDDKTRTVTGEGVTMRTAGEPLTDGRQNVYTKGPLVIRHLEYLFRVQKKSDGVFWEMLRDFLQKNPYKSVTTEEFIAAAEAKMGGKLGWFWDQWLYGSGFPVIRWSYDVAPHPEGGWILTVEIRQEGTAFTFPIPVRIDTGGKEPMEAPVAVRGAQGGKLQVRLREKPRKVTLNDDWRVPVDVRN